MADSEKNISADDAKEALAVIKNAESEGLRHTLSPRWFGVVIALINGGLVAVAAAGKTTLVAVLMAALAGAVASRRRKMKAYPAPAPRSTIGVVAAIGLIAFGIGLIAAAKILAEAYAFAYAPLVSGAIMATVIYLLSVSERREQLRKIEKGAGE